MSDRKYDRKSDMKRMDNFNERNLFSTTIQSLKLLETC